MIKDLLAKSLMIVFVGMGVVFCFIQLMIIVINLNAKIVRMFGKAETK